jgi:hypothetical protein
MPGAEPGWPARGERGAGVAGAWGAGRRRPERAGKNEKTGRIHKLGAYVPRMGQGT